MKKIYLFVLLFSLTAQYISAQGWELFSAPEPVDAAASEVLPTLDGNYLVRGTRVTPNFGPIYRKLTDQGQIIWERQITGGITNNSHMNNLSDNTYIIIGEVIENIPGAGTTFRPELIKLDQDGNTLWQITPLFPGDDRQITFYRTIALDNGNFIFGGRKIGGTGPIVNMVGEITSDGTLLWSNELSFFGALEYRKNNGNLIFSEANFNDDNLFRYESDAQGNLVNTEAVLNSVDYRRFIFSEDGSTYYISYNQPSNEEATKLVMHKMDAALNIVAKDSIIWEGRLSVQKFRLLDDKLAITGYTSFNFPQEEWITGFFLVANADDLQVDFTKSYTRYKRSYKLNDVTKSNQSGYIVAGGINPSAVDPSVSMTQMYIFKTDLEGNLYSNVISGAITVDNNDNCEIEDDELPAQHWIITAHKPGLTTPFGTVSDDNGAYQLPVDTGNYTLHLTPQSDYWEPCTNDINVNFSAFQQDTTIDFSIAPITDCPAMVVNVAAPIVRPCLSRPVYLSYCNSGPVTATDAYLEVNLDPLLTPTSASIPWDNLSSNNTLTWNLGDLEPLECGAITFFVELDCEAETGLSYCIDANIFPDTICTTSSTLWSGAFLEVSGTCVDDQINFEIKNIGEAPMVEPSHFIIVEDAVLRESDETQLLAPEMEQNFQFDGNGATYTLLVDQVENAPGNSNPIAIIEACGESDNGDFSINFGNQFPQNDYNLGTDTDCPIAVNSFDPNDKNATPEGYQTEHYIEPETPLEYTIRFQNTGTDIAFLVVIKDTLSQWLDITTFQEGNSSHPYELGLTGQGYLTFTFYDINLPDSTSNLEASNGFVNFKITPLADTPVETVITNQAGIYFDFNDPIITNETFHTIVPDYLEVLVTSVSHPTLSNIEVAVAPNPFQGTCIFEIKNHTTDKYLLEIFDATGKLMQSENMTGNTLSFDGSGLNPGMYFYRLTAADGFKSTGRMVAF